MRYLIMSMAGVLSLATSDTGAAMAISLDPYSNLGDGVELQARFIATDPDLSLDTINLELIWRDKVTSDVIYSFNGTLSSDPDSTSTLDAVVDASETMRDFTVTIANTANFLTAVALCDGYNAYNALQNKKVLVNWVSDALSVNVDAVYDALTQVDDTPTRLSMIFRGEVALYTQLLRVAQKLNIRFFVELDPTLTVDQAIAQATDLAPNDTRVAFIWAPILARPINAISLRGKKKPRCVSGTLMGRHALRDARGNAQGIPPYHEPIAGFDFPFNYIGIESANIVLDDVTRKRLANAQVNVVERQKYRSGVRFVLGDVLTANGDNTAILKLINASDVAMFIDNTINQIVLRHLLKGMTTFIEDATKEAVKFLDSCTTKERQLLVTSQEIGSFYSLSIVPRTDRPFDAVDVSTAYRPNGATRAVYVNNTVTK